MIIYNIYICYIYINYTNSGLQTTIPKNHANGFVRRPRFFQPLWEAPSAAPESPAAGGPNNLGTSKHSMAPWLPASLPHPEASAWCGSTGYRDISGPGWDHHQWRCSYWETIQNVLQSLLFTRFYVKFGICLIIRSIPNCLDCYAGSRWLPQMTLATDTYLLSLEGLFCPGYVHWVFEHVQTTSVAWSN